MLEAETLKGHFPVTHQLMRFESINQAPVSTFDHFSKQFIDLQAVGFIRVP